MLMMHRLKKLILLQRALISDMSLDEKFKKITDSVVKIFNADFGRIWISSPGTAIRYTLYTHR
jgi:hypothetical protein